MKRPTLILLAVALLLDGVGEAKAALIDFTGGTVFYGAGETATTNNAGVYGAVDYYEQDGYRFDFIGDPSNQWAGNYYTTGNDVLHAHFLDGFGLVELRVSKIDGSSFDLTSLVITSNTQIGGGPATGAEMSFLNASYDGSTIGASLRLPSDDWGDATTELVTPGAAFTNLRYFSITTAPDVFCVGIDNVLVQDAAAAVPEPSSLALLGAGASWAAGFYGWRRKRAVSA